MDSKDRYFEAIQQAHTTQARQYTITHVATNHINVKLKTNTHKHTHSPHSFTTAKRKKKKKLKNSLTINIKQKRKRIQKNKHLTDVEEIYCRRKPSGAVAVVGRKRDWGQV